MTNLGLNIPFFTGDVVSDIRALEPSQQIREVVRKAVSGVELSEDEYSEGII
jgi:hypothetical protein